MPRDEHTHLVHAFLGQARERTPLRGARLFVTGSAQDHSQFYELVESCGAVIVAEDHDWGNRHFEGDMDQGADPIDAIVDRYHMRSPSAARSSISARVNTLLEQVCAAGAQGVIAFIYQKDDAPAWDFPEQRAALEKQGVPVLLLDHQPYPMGDVGVLGREIRAFVATCQEVAQ
jgi:benzoyl-CoA reductase/2-hydroxyglutaryl-CoA dehydratase subunit BcrC/BadD/HgdB